jgi:hypothetical protein
LDKIRYEIDGSIEVRGRVADEENPVQNSRQHTLRIMDI